MVPETVVDNHLHLSPGGRSVEAVREFSRAGGTHVFCPNLLPSSYGVDVEGGGDFGEVFEAHLDHVSSVDERVDGVEILPLVGVHPAEVPKLRGKLGPEEGEEAVSRGLEIAAELVAGGEAVAIGEVGRPHYDVEEAVLEASNRLLGKAFRLAAREDCAVQLHTERMDADGVKEIGALAEQEGLDPGRVIHHFSPPLVEECRGPGTVPSVLARSEFVEEAAESGDRFLLETDYLDDPERPGAVLGPKTVPRRTLDLLERGLLTEEATETVHRKLPERVYGIDIEPP